MAAIFRIGRLRGGTIFILVEMKGIGKLAEDLKRFLWWK